MLTEQSIKILKANGWSENRDIDIDEYRKTLKEKGFISNNYWEEVVKKYGGLYIEYYNPRYMNRRIEGGVELEEAKNDAKGNFDFNIFELLEKDYNVKAYHGIAEMINKNFLPIGNCNYESISLFIEQNGKVYMFMDGEILDEYESVDDLLNKEFIRTFAEVIE